MKYKAIFLVLVITPLLFPGCSRPEVTTEIETIEDLIFYYPEIAQLKIDSLNKIGISSHRISFLESFLLYQKGEIDSALVKIEQSINESLRNNNTEEEAKCHFVLGLISEGVGQWEQAKINYLKSINLAPVEVPYNALSYYGLARCKSYLGEHYTNELAQGQSLLIETGKTNHLIYSNYLRTVLKDDFKRSDIPKLLNIAKEYEEHKLFNNAINVLKSAAIKYNYFNELDSALITLDKGIELYTTSYPGISELPALYQIKGAILFKKQKEADAIQCLNTALSYYDKHNLHERKYFAYTYLRRFAFKNKDYKSAYEFLDKAHQIEHQTKSISKARIAKLMEITANVNDLSSELDKVRFQKTLIMLIMLCGIVITSYVIHIIIKRNKEKHDKVEQRNANLHQLIIGLNEKVLHQKRYGKEFESTSGVSKITTLADQFDECYNETMILLIDNYGSLSRTECRYALLFGIGYGDDTICSVQSVQKSAVRKAKQRIRTKLNLSKEIDLRTFFNDYIESAVSEGVIKNEKFEGANL